MRALPSCSGGRCRLADGGEVTDSSHCAASVGLLTREENEGDAHPTCLGVVVVESPPELSNLLCCHHPSLSGWKMPPRN